MTEFLDRMEAELAALHARIDGLIKAIRLQKTRDLIKAIRLQKARDEAPTGPSIDNAIEYYGLTKCEGAIIKMIAKGMSNKEAAQALNVNERTVKHHMSGIMEKLQVTSRLQAVLKLGDPR